LVTRSIRIQDVLRTALTQVIGAVDARAGAIYVWDATAKCMNIEAWSGLPHEVVEKWRRVEADHELLRKCLAWPEPVVAADSLPEAAAMLASLREREGFEQVWLVPLRSAGEVVGIVQLAFDRVVAAAAANTETLVAVSRQVSSAVANAKLYEQTRTQAAALEAANQEMAAINGQLLAANLELREANETITAQHASLVRAAKMASMGTLAAGIAHEINNPLAIIAGYSEALLRRIESGETIAEAQLDRLRRYLEAINSECFRCKEITQGLLALSRERTLTRNVGNVNECIEETLALLNFHLEHDARSVALDLDPAIPDMACDPNQLQQVFLNLALNAMDAMGPGQKLHITTSAGDGWIRAELCDEGSGIQPELLDRIFDPFFTTKPEGSGTGLGLAMCQAIIEQHEGTIDVASVLGEGTTFTIRLPIKDPPAAGEAPSASALGGAAA
jgi:signal transduction histidine kinase